MIEFSMIMEVLFYVEQTERFFLIESKFSWKIGKIVFISVLLQQVSGIQQALPMCWLFL